MASCTVALSLTMRIEGVRALGPSRLLCFSAPRQYRFRVIDNTDFDL